MLVGSWRGLLGLGVPTGLGCKTRQKSTLLLQLKTFPPTPLPVFMGVQWCHFEFPGPCRDSTAPKSLKMCKRGHCVLFPGQWLSYEEGTLGTVSK
jgi:hypothetical protein